MSSAGLSDVKRRQLLAIQMLQKIGFVYLSPEEVAAERRGRLGEVLLESTLRVQLRRLNAIESSGLCHEFSDENIVTAIELLRDLTSPLVAPIASTYGRLLRGGDLEVSIDGETARSRFRYIDWRNPLNNAFHVTSDFYVGASGAGLGDRAPIVAFINGIPMIVIECLSSEMRSQRDVAAERFEHRMQSQSGSPLFCYTPLLIGLFPETGLINTPGGPVTDWNPWEDREGETALTKVHDLVNSPPEAWAHHKLFSGGFDLWKETFERRVLAEQEVLPQDQLLWSLCRPERLIEFLGSFADWDSRSAALRLATRQQFFAAKRLRRRLVRLGPHKGQNGGLFWYTQCGDDVGLLWFLFRFLASDPRLLERPIVVVSSRIDPFEGSHGKRQLWDCEVGQIKTGRQLKAFLGRGQSQPKRTVITWDCFKSALGRQWGSLTLGQETIFLVDEIHRDFEPRLIDRIAQKLPRANVLFLLETPPTRRMKRLASRLGKRLNRNYSFDEALEDRAVVPLYLEQRPGFLVKDPILPLARDLSDHFSRCWKGTGFGGVVFLRDDAMAGRLMSALDEVGMVRSEIVRSGVLRKGDLDSVEEMVEPKLSQRPDIRIIVGESCLAQVAPNDRILYLVEPIEARCLLGALFAMSRRSVGKSYGLVVDYRTTPKGKGTPQVFSTDGESGFERRDVRGIFWGIDSAVARISDRLEELKRLTRCGERWNEQNWEIEEMSEARFRIRFYEVFSDYCRLLHLAHSSRHWLMLIRESEIQELYRALWLLQRIRLQLRQRYADELDHPESDSILRKLLQLSGVEDLHSLMPEPIDILRLDQFEMVVASMKSLRAKADLIANQTIALLSHWAGLDPFFCREYSDLIQVAMDHRRRGDIDDEEYYQRVAHYLDVVQCGRWPKESEREKTPGRGDALVEVIKETIGVKMRISVPMKEWRLAEPVAPYWVQHGKRARGSWVEELASRVAQLIGQHCTVGWQGDVDLQNRLKNDIDDCLLEFQALTGLKLTFSEIDDFTERTLSVIRGTGR